MTKEENEFITIMETVVSAIRKVGQDPYAQLYGYLKTDYDMYITRTDNARELIRTLAKDDISRYIETLK